LILNSPHNPTGGILNRSHWNRLRKSAKASARSGSMPTRSIRGSAMRANSSPSRSCPACTSAPSFPMAPPRPGR
jgi:hypothetical protein